MKHLNNFLINKKLTKDKIVKGSRILCIKMRYDGTNIQEIKYEQIKADNKYLHEYVEYDKLFNILISVKKCDELFDAWRTRQNVFQEILNTSDMDKFKSSTDASIYHGLPQLLFEPHDKSDETINKISDFLKSIISKDELGNMFLNIVPHDHSQSYYLIPIK